ncbi:hypothetical protein MUK42_00050 [Musa troglodytarum]|uniref:Uncharacterized protein n=1 Tax=Musa troglodytarum TaxID=320322 RepID=A0A9E7FCM9_9LILI|nr:hypothetical protein MUK42_00050 [Musa troglodytarum]
MQGKLQLWFSSFRREHTCPQSKLMKVENQKKVTMPKALRDADYYKYDPNPGQIHDVAENEWIRWVDQGQPTVGRLCARINSISQHLKQSGRWGPSCLYRWPSLSITPLPMPPSVVSPAVPGRATRSVGEACE